MEIPSCYIEFRSRLLAPAYNPGEIVGMMIKAIAPVAKSLNIGYIAYSFSAPSTPLSPTGVLFKGEVYHDVEKLPVVPTQTDVAETLSTEEQGVLTFFAHPIENHTFTDGERESIRLLCWDWFVLCGRSHLMGLNREAGLTDQMTGIKNHAGLRIFIDNCVKENTIKNYTGIFINLKNFKYINRSMGSQMGDLAIRMYANMAKQFMNDDEIVVRLGGDNFLVLVKKERQDKFISEFFVKEISLSRGPKPMNVRIQTRMGVYPVNERDTITEVMHNSNIALNVARSVKTTDIIYFTSEMLVQSLHQREISSEFHNAIRNRELVVFYQPKVDLVSKKINGSEALVRWIRHKTIVPPMDFIPVLEREGSICDLDFYVFETVCADIRQWIDAGISPVKISTNFSKMHLKQPNAAEKIVDIVKKYEIDCQYVEIELTEVSDYNDSMAMDKFINYLRQNGVAVSIDDFGTGYSTLNVLKEFNVNTIKLDRSLLNNIGNPNSQDEIILRNVVKMAKEMQKDVIAEGVETEVQAEFLKAIDCTNAQGFLFDRPLIRDDFVKRLASSHKY